PGARAGGGAAGGGHGRHARGRGVSRGDRGPDRPRPARGGGARGRARPAPRRRRPAGGHGTARARARPRPSRPRPDGGPAGGVPGGGGGAQGTPARRHPRRPGRRGRVAGLPHGGGALGGARSRPLAGAAGTGRAPRRARRHSLPRARMTEPALSVVVPALNEEDRLPRTLERIVSHLGRRREGYELVVVDDGSRDRTAERAQAAGATVLRNEATRGKGYAVRRGLLAGSGAGRLMTDADLSTPIEELDRLCARMDEGHDVVIGSRALPGARIEVHQPWYRENMGRLFNLFVRALAVPGVTDTQCGFKLFSASAARDVFSSARLDGFSFDVEVLFLARRKCYRIAEVPVVWRNDAASRVSLVRGFLAFPDLLRIRTNDWRGRYGL